MKYLILMTVLLLSSCATTRTRENDAKLRVAIDPKGILQSEYRALRQELIASGNFVVVDRAAGLKAVVDEQDLEHKTLQNRFDDEQKYAEYGKLYGVGSVIKAERHCEYQFTPLVIISFWNTCEVSLTMVDASTGVVITQVGDSLMFQSPRWGVSQFEDLVEDLIDSYPAKFKTGEVESLADSSTRAKASAQKARQDLKSESYQTLGEDE